MRAVAPAGIVHCFLEMVLFGAKNEEMKIICTYFMNIAVELDLWLKKLTVTAKKGWYSILYGFFCLHTVHLPKFLNSTLDAKNFDIKNL